VHTLMAALEARGKAAAAGDVRIAVAQPVRLVVQPYDHNYVMWPSYVEKQYVHYNEQLLARQVWSSPCTACTNSSATRALLLREQPWGVGRSC